MLVGNIGEVTDHFIRPGNPSYEPGRININKTALRCALKYSLYGVFKNVPVFIDRFFELPARLRSVISLEVYNICR